MRHDFQRRLLTATVLTGLLSGTAPARAVLLSIDMDPGTAGVQDTRTVQVGDSIQVDLVVSGIEDDSEIPDDGLSAYEWDVDYDSTILTATDVAGGGFLPAPALVVEADLAPPDVNFAEAVLGVGVAFGSGVLSSITFDVTGAGLTTLDLNDVILSMPFGKELAGVTLEDGTLTVISASVPAPGTVPLLGTALLAGPFVGRGNRGNGRNGTAGKS